MSRLAVHAVSTERLDLLPLHVEHAAETELAWVVGTSWQGSGIASEAARGLGDWLTRQPVHTVIAHIHPDHRASAAVATAAGLVPTDERHEGEIRWRRCVR